MHFTDVQRLGFVSKTQENSQVEEHVCEIDNQKFLAQPCIFLFFSLRKKYT